MLINVADVPYALLCAKAWLKKKKKREATTVACQCEKTGIVCALGLDP